MTVAILGSTPTSMTHADTNVEGQLLLSKSNQTKPSPRLLLAAEAPRFISDPDTFSTCWRFYFKVAEGGNTEKLGNTDTPDTTSDLNKRTRTIEKAPIALV